MATVNRRVKRVDATKPRFFDEQGWPVYAVAAILAACGFAIIRAYADFLTPNFFKNAFLYCFLLTGASIGGFMLLRYYSQRTFRRLQLCFLLSILFHLVLSLFLLSCFFDVATVRDKVVDREIPPPDKMLEMVDIPDILLKQEIEEVKKPIDKPEEITETPQPQEPEVIKEKAEPEPEPVKEKELLVEKPPEETMQQPNPVEQERREITPPKFAEVMAREKPTRQTKVWETVPEKARPEVVQKTQPKKSEQAVAQMDTQARESAQDPLVKQRQLDVELPQAKERTELAKVEPQRRKTENAQPVERNVVKSPSTQRAKPLELVQADAPIPVEKPTTPREDPSELTPKQREQLASRTTEVKDPAKQVAQSDTPPAPTEVAQVNLTQRARNEDLSPSRTHQPAQQRNVKPVEKIADIKPQLEEEQPQEKPQPRELLAQVQPSSRSVPHPATAPPPVPVKQTELAPAPETAETQQPTVAKTTPRRRQSPQEPTQLAETQPRKAPEKVEPQKKPSEQLAEVKPEKTTPTAQSKPVAQVAVKNVTEASTKPPTTQPKPAAQTQQALASAPAATNPQTTTKAPTAREPSPTSTPAKVAETTPRQKPNQRVTEQELASLTSEVQAERAEPQASKSLAAETPTLVAKNQAPSAKTSNLPTPTVQQVATQAPQVPQPSATSQPQTTPAARRTPTEQKNEIATRSPSPASPQTPSRQEKAVELPSTSLLAKSEAEAPSRGAAASHSSQMDLANNAVIKTAGATPQESKTPTSSSNSPNATASASAPAKSGTLRAATQQVATATPTRTKPLPAREPTAANASGQLAAKEITTPVTPVPNSASGTVTPQVTTTARAGAAATTGAQVTQSSPAEQAAGLGSLPVEGEASLAATTPTQTLRQPSPSEITPSTRAAGGMRQPTPTTGTNAALAAADAQPEVESSPRPETLTTPLSPNQIAKLAATDAPDAKTAVPESAEAQQTPTSEAPSPQATQETAQQVVASTPVRRELTTATIETAATARAEQDQPSTQPRHLATTPINQMNVSNPAPEQQDNVAVGKTSAAEIMPQLATSFAKKTSTAPANTMPQPMEAATGENIPTLTGMQSNATTPSPSTPRKSELALVQPTSSPSRAQPKRTEVSSPRASSTGAIAAETEPTAKGQRVASATPKVEAQMSAAAGKAATPSLVEKVSDATMPVPELLTADATSAAVPTQAPSFEPQWRFRTHNPLRRAKLPPPCRRST